MITGINGYDNGNDNGNGNDGFITVEQAAAHTSISFLEQAEQPPIFQQLPRGGQNKLKMKMRGNGRIFYIAEAFLFYSNEILLLMHS